MEGEERKERYREGEREERLGRREEKETAREKIKREIGTGERVESRE